ncbi:MAG: SIS domain-containing protein [Candidatus Omnitrophica bacterium]|nr:SIS domain-containing protein [Candidatus Omnitrophota bacterium]
MNVTSYFSDFDAVLKNCLKDLSHRKGLEKSVKILKATRKTRHKIILVGNGGSSAIAEHMAIDLTKNAGLKAMAFSGSPMLTTFANDFGYEKVFQKAIETFGDQGDVLIAISSGGTSKNILNAVSAAKAKGMKVITLSGFAPDNPLRAKGDINIWVNSRAFGYVELIHNLLLHYINDAIIGKAEYMIR